MSGQECRCQQNEAGRFKQFKKVSLDPQVESSGQGLNSDLITVAGAACRGSKGDA